MTTQHYPINLGSNHWARWIRYNTSQLCLQSLHFNHDGDQCFAFSEVDYKLPVDGITGIPVDPITVNEELFCSHCRDNGTIENGRWIRK